MTDATGMQATAEYYAVRIYRRGPGGASYGCQLVGVSEDVDGKQQVFRCSEELWEALIGGLGSGRVVG